MTTKTKVLAFRVSEAVAEAVAAAAAKKHVAVPQYLKWRVAEAVSQDCGFKPETEPQAA
jgi:hypothetical protein